MELFVAFWRPLCSGFCVLELLVLRSERNRPSGTEMSFRSCVLELRSGILILRSGDPSAMVSAFWCCVLAAFWKVRLQTHLPWFLRFGFDSANLQTAF